MGKTRITPHFTESAFRDDRSSKGATAAAAGGTVPLHNAVVAGMKGVPLPGTRGCAKRAKIVFVDSTAKHNQWNHGTFFSQSQCFA